MRFSIFVNITSYFVLIFISLETSDLCCKQLCFLGIFFITYVCGFALALMPRLEASPWKQLLPLALVKVSGTALVTQAR